MRSSTETLISVLQSELLLFRQLEAVLAEEAEALRGLDTARILTLANEKDGLTLQLRALEESRRLAIERLAGEQGYPGDPEALRLEEIAKRAPAGEGRELRRLAGALQETVAAGQAKNATNRVLTDHSLRLTRDTIAALSQPDEIHQTYRPSGGMRAYRLQAQVVTRRI